MDRLPARGVATSSPITDDSAVRIFPWETVRRTRVPAAMMESLAVNHPFVDGNRREAFFVTDAFLRMNGSFIDCDGEAAYEHFMRLSETNTFRFAELRSWLEERRKAN